MIDDIDKLKLIIEQMTEAERIENSMDKLMTTPDLMTDKECNDLFTIIVSATKGFNDCTSKPKLITLFDQLFGVMAIRIQSNKCNYWVRCVTTADGEQEQLVSDYDENKSYKEWLDLEFPNAQPHPNLTVLPPNVKATLVEYFTKRNPDGDPDSLLDIIFSDEFKQLIMKLFTPYIDYLELYHEDYISWEYLLFEGDSMGFIEWYVDTHDPEEED